MLARLQLINHQLLQRLTLRRCRQLTSSNLLNVAIDIILNWVESNGSENVEELGELLSGGKEGGGVDGVVLLGVDWDVDEGGLHVIEERHVCGFDM